MTSAHGLMWRDAPVVYGPPKTLYKRFIRWSRIGLFDRIFASLAAGSEATDTVMINATRLKAHRTAASLLKKGLFPAVSGAQRAIDRQAARRVRRQRQAPDPAAD